MEWLWFLVAITIIATILFFKLQRQVKFKNNVPIIAQSLGLKYIDRIDQLSDYIAAEKTDLPPALSDPENVKQFQIHAGFAQFHVCWD